MIEKVILTSLVLAIVFLAIINFYGDDRPARWVVWTLVPGLVLSAFIFVASLIALIWA